MKAGDDADLVQLDVRGLGGQICFISLQTSSRVHTVRSEIQRAASIPAVEQKLLTESGLELKDENATLGALLSRAHAEKGEEGNYTMVLMLVRTLPIGVRKILEQLESPNSRNREQAVKELRSLGTVGVLPALENAMTDANWFVCWAVADVLGQLGAHDILVNALADCRQPVRQGVSRVLVRLEQKSLPALEEALRDKRTLVRREAAQVIGALRDKRIVTLVIIDKLRQLACEDVEPDVRVIATQVHAQVCRKPISPDVMKEVARGLRDAIPAVRRESVAALGHLGVANLVMPSLVETLSSDVDNEVILQLLDEIRACGGQGVPAIPALLTMLVTHPTVSVRRKIPGTLAAVVGSDKAAVVRGLAQALAEENAREDGSGCKCDADADVRSEAAKALGNVGPEASQAQTALVQALRQDTVAIVRCWAAFALGQLGKRTSNEARQALQVALNDGFPYVRARAAVALNRTGLSKKVPPRLRQEAITLLPHEDLPSSWDPAEAEACTTDADVEPAGFKKGTHDANKELIEAELPRKRRCTASSCSLM